MAASFFQLLFGAHAHSHLEGYEIPWHFLQNPGYSFTQMIEVKKKRKQTILNSCKKFATSFLSGHFNPIDSKKLEQAVEEI